MAIMEVKLRLKLWTMIDSVVLKGKLHNPVSDLTGTIGLGKLGVLRGLSNFEGYSDTKGKIEVVKKSKKW